MNVAASSPPERPMISRGEPVHEEPAAITTSHHPTVGELEEVLRAAATRAVHGTAVAASAALARAGTERWDERSEEIFGVFVSSEDRLGYLAGSRRPAEVAAAVMRWIDSPLSVGQVRMIVACGGWDPDPFVPVAEAGLLEPLLFEPDGSRRRVQEELAGGWLSDAMALASDTEVLHAVRGLLRSGSPDGDGEAAELHVTLARPLVVVEAAVRDALSKNGFGVLTEIDVSSTFEEKLGLHRPPLKILGACNPALAHRALELEPNMALVLPCNVVLEETDTDTTRVAMADPRRLVHLAGTGAPALKELADEAASALRAVLEALQGRD